jgi:phosphodiesterase/alkaline phosphatase D-like protein
VGILDFIVLAALAAAPSAVTGPGEQVATTSATVGGTVTPNGAPTVYWVEYGTSSWYGLSTKNRSAGDGTAPVSVHIPISGITPDTDYHYRLVASNDEGVAKGNDAKFHTPAPIKPPRVTPGANYPIAATSATLRGTVRGEADAVRVAEQIAGLRPHTRYYLRLVATNAVPAAS